MDRGARVFLLPVLTGAIDFVAGHLWREVWLVYCEQIQVFHAGIIARRFQHSILKHAKAVFTGLNCQGMIKTNDWRRLYSRGDW